MISREKKKVCKLVVFYSLQIVFWWCIYGTERILQKGNVPNQICVSMELYFLACGKSNVIFEVEIKGKLNAELQIRNIYVNEHGWSLSYSLNLRWIQQQQFLYKHVFLCLTWKWDYRHAINLTNKNIYNFRSI